MAEGQFSGIKGAYVYETDNGGQFVIRRDQTLATVSGVGLTAATQTGSFLFSLPIGFKPRGVHWQGTLNGRIVRKFLICGRDSTLYESDRSSAITVDNIAGFTTGKRGESFSFVRLAADPQPPG